MFTKNFFVPGDVLGETTVVATAKYGDRSTASLPMPIQVFPPLQLEPRNITLIIGAKFQVRVVGGPQPSSALEFALANGELFNILSNREENLQGHWTKCHISCVTSYPVNLYNT